MDLRKFPVVEFDSEKKALIKPFKGISKKKVPETCIIPFYYKTVENLKTKGILKEITHDSSIATANLPIYELKYKKSRIAVLTSGLGAPFSAAMLEYAIALGCKKFLVIGSGGVLDSTIDRDQFIILTSAIRDEGTSYQYVSASREISVDPAVVKIIQDFLDNKEIKYHLGKTWTTDCVYRETIDRIKKRKKEGALIVEMEASALLAVAKFREVSLGYILAAGDDVGGLEWDSRNLLKIRDFHERFFWLAAELCLKL